MPGKSEAELKKMKLADLKKVCLLNSLPNSGSKQDLIDRILAHDAEKSPVTVQPEEEAELLDEDDTSPVEVPAVTPTPAQTTTSTVLPKVTEEKPQSEPSTNPTEAAQPAPTKIDVSKMSMEERIALRKQRFGGSGDSTESKAAPRPIINAPDLDKRMERAKRFGLPVADVPKSTEERLKKRAERFGISSDSKKPGLSADEEERKRKRMERFGLSVGAPLSEEEQKKREARAIRFGLVPSDAKKPRIES